MTPAAAHYQDLLSAIYTWGVGGHDAAIASTGEWLRSLPLPPPPGRVLDLGAGFGAAAIPLARQGYDVVAVDFSSALLAELAAIEGGDSVHREEAELGAFLDAETRPADLVLCVGDTLPHLASHADVESFLRHVRRLLRPEGVVVLSFREIELAPGECRFLLVRADERRSHTCMLQGVDKHHMQVWDILHERSGEVTEMRVSSYAKLRLTPEWVLAAARQQGLRGEAIADHWGMAVLILSAEPEAS